MNRCVEPELLDELPPADPRAVRSRRDLLRVNAWMGNCEIMARALQPIRSRPAARGLAELGAGDGRFLLRVARRLPSDWRGTRAVLLDRWNIVSPATRRDFAAVGWRVATVQAEALGWLTQPDAPACDVLIANLFLHHFPERPLAELLRGAAKLARTLIAVEPRRSGPSLCFSRLLWFIGCNGVTRHDARVSVRAGFVGRELSQLWPAGQGWSLQERPAGWCSHLFIARRED